jgi:hypothetical protein
MAATKQNLVTFWPNAEGAARVFLQMDAPIVLQAGIAPQIWQATVPHTEFDKLGSAAGGMRGQIELWFNSDPAPGHRVTS